MLEALPGKGVSIDKISALYETEPVGTGPQPMFVNGALAGRTRHDPLALLAELKAIEREAGRQSRERWGPRPLDLDILAFGTHVQGWTGPHDPAEPGALVIPHPEMHRRSFVLVPLADVSSDWVHPIYQRSVVELLADLPPEGPFRRLETAES